MRPIKERLVERGTPVWLGVSVAVALVIAVGGLRLGTGVVSVAFDLETSLSDLREVSVGRLVLDESSDLGDLDRRVTQVKADVEPATGLMRWVRRFAPAISWLPVARQEIATWAD